MIRFDPLYVLAPWGSRRLEHEFGRELPDGPVGESWELSDLEHRPSRVREGPHQEKTLGQLWHSGVIGGSAEGPFPFLLKWLTTEDRLSVQVHPDEAAVERVGQGKPKHEAWYIAHVEPGAMLMVGHYPGLDAATLRQAAQGGTIHKWLYEVGPRVGEMFEIAAGTLHTIGPGFMLLEVQQPSDTTFRVYDWGRVGLDGKARDLHLDEACQSVVWERFGPPKAKRQEAAGPSFVMRTLRTNTELAAGPLRCLVSHSGATRIITERDELTLEYGEVAVAETDDGKIRVSTGTCLLLTEP